MHLLRGERWHGFCDRDKWSDGLGISRARGNRDKFLLWITECRQATAENTAGIYVYCSIQPVGLRHWRMAVNNHGLAAILSGPVVANGQAEFVGLAGRLAVQRKIANLSRTTALHLFSHPR